METRTYTVYKFDELPDDAQEKAINNNFDINVDYEWWEFTYEDAEHIGLKLDGFDLGRAQEIIGHLDIPAERVCEAIFSEHGENCDTYQTAKRYAHLLDAVKDCETEEDEDRYQNLSEEFEYALLQDYLSMLQKDYDYLCSAEAIEETLRENDYDFTIDGRIA